MPRIRTNNKVQKWTPRDAEVIDIIFQACPPQSKPKISDWATIARKLGFKNAQVARDTYRILCKKRDWFTATGSQSESGSDLESGPPSSFSRQKEAAAQDDRTINTKKYNTRGSAKKELQGEIKTESREDTIWDDIFGTEDVCDDA